MNILTAIGGIESLIDELFDEEPLGLDFSEEEYEDEIRHLFEKQTKDIQDNLNRVIERSSKEDIAAARRRFFHNTNRVQSRLQQLKEKVEESSQSLSEDDIKRALQIKFCKRTISFIETIDSQLESLSEVALSKAELQDTYFHVIREKERLPQIYHALVEKHWIEGDETSLGDFTHFFGGEGLKPRHRIKWNKPLTMLAAFIDLMTDDNNAISKGARIFSICTDKDVDYHPITRDSLKQSRANALNAADKHHFFTYQKIIKKEIFRLT